MEDESKNKVINFFHDIYKDLKDDEVLTITTMAGKSKKMQVRHFYAKDLDQMIEAGINAGEKSNTYFNVNPLVPGVGEFSRGKADQVSSVVTLWADYDVFHPVAHKEQNLPKDDAVVLEHLQSLPIPPTYIIQSGYGVDPYWVLEKVDTTDEEARNSVFQDITEFGQYLTDKAKEAGFCIDNVFDPCRMMRFPASLNFKDEAQPKRGFFYSDCGKRYTLQEIMGAIKADDINLDIPQVDDSEIPVEEDECTESPSEEDEEDVVKPSDFDPRIWGSADRIQERCAVAKYLFEQPELQPEPMWYGICSNTPSIPDGEAWYHKLSKDYPKYSFDETQKKLDYAKKSKKMCSCKFFRNHFTVCPVQGCNVRFPFEHAKYTLSEQLNALIEDKEELTLDKATDEYVIRLMRQAKNAHPVEYAKFKDKLRKAKISTRDFDNAVNKQTFESDNQIEKPKPKKLFLQGLQLGGALIPVNYDVGIEKGVTYYDSNENLEQLICPEPVVIISRTENVDDGHEEIEIAFFKNRHWKTLQTQPSVLFNKNQIIHLADEGLTVTSDTASDLVGFLFAYSTLNRPVIPVIRSIDRVGWMSNFKEFFPCYVKDKVIYEDKEQSLIKAMHESGDFQIWQKTAEKIRKNTFARCILSASFASPLLEVVKTRIILLHLWHNSRSGKTAALKFALSVWGDPVELMGNFNSTSVGLERRAGILKHLPLGVDELQEINKNLSPSTIVYQLGNGQGKTRGAKNGGLQETLTWRNAIITTGEQPLSSECSMDGVINRAIEVYGIPFDNADFGREVHQIAEQNFGMAGRWFIQYLITEVFTNKGKVLGDYSRIRDTLKQKFTELNLGDVGAHLDSIAVISLADMYSSLALFPDTLCEDLYSEPENVAFDSAVELGLEILKNLKMQEKEDSIERAWHFVRDWVGSNRKKFNEDSDPCFGKFNGNVTLINASQLRDAMNREGFNYSKSLKGFAERKYINTFSEAGYKGRFQKTATIYGISMRVIEAMIHYDGVDLARTDFCNPEGIVPL